jgi:hypothetical protein
MDARIIFKKNSIQFWILDFFCLVHIYVNISQFSFSFSDLEVIEYLWI